MIKRIIIILTILTLTTGCFEKSDGAKFKKEFEKHNTEKIKVKIERDNIIKYATSDEINEIIEKKSGVIFIGNPKDAQTRKAAEVLLKAAENTDLKEIYYIDNYKELPKVKEIKSIKTPIVINVLEGQIIGYHMGTLNNTAKLKEKEEEELYNIYSNGIHSVLQDICDEECTDE